MIENVSKKSCESENPKNPGSDLPPNWSWVKLGDVAKIVYGKGLSTKDLMAEGFPVFGANGVIGFFNRYLYEKSQILISCRGAYSGKINFSPEKAYITNNSLVVEIINVKILWKKFLFYALINSKKEKLVTGTAQPQVTINNAVELNIPLPPLPEQKKIVEKIEELFSDLANGVASLKKAKEQIKLYRQSVLTSAFNGKLIGNGNTDEKTDLPKGWRRVKLGDAAQIINGFAFKSGNLKNQGKYQVVKIGNVRPGNLRLEAKPAFINDVDEKVFCRSSLKKNDLVISLTGTRKKRDYGYVAMVTNQKNLLLNQRLATIRLNKEYDPKFFLYLLRMDIFLDQFFRNETGNVGQGNVGIGGIRDSIVSAPSFIEQTQIVEEIEKRFSEADNLEKAIDESLEKADRLRQSILKKAFEGKLV